MAKKKLRPIVHADGRPVLNGKPLKAGDLLLIKLDEVWSVSEVAVLSRRTYAIVNWNGVEALLPLDVDYNATSHELVAARIKRPLSSREWMELTS